MKTVDVVDKLPGVTYEVACLMGGAISSWLGLMLGVGGAVKHDLSFVTVGSLLFATGAAVALWSFFSVLGKLHELCVTEAQEPRPAAPTGMAASTAVEGLGVLRSNPLQDDEVATP